MLGVAITLPYDGDHHGPHTSTRANIPIYVHMQKARPPLSGKAGSVGAITVGARSTWRKKD